MGEIKFSLRVQILEWSQNTHAAVTRVNTKTSKRERACCRTFGNPYKVPSRLMACPYSIWVTYRATAPK
jgi:hypothetical protein